MLVQWVSTGGEMRSPAGLTASDVKRISQPTAMSASLATRVFAYFIGDAQLVMRIWDFSMCAGEQFYIFASTSMVDNFRG